MKTFHLVLLAWSTDIGYLVMPTTYGALAGLGAGLTMILGANVLSAVLMGR